MGPWLVALLLCLLPVQGLSVAHGASGSVVTQNLANKCGISNTSQTCGPDAKRCRSLEYLPPFSPPNLPNYKLKVYWHLYESLNPWAVYAIANHLMYGLASQGWSDPLSQDSRMAEDHLHRAGIVITDDTPNRDLRTGHVVRALYGLIYDMATQNPGFYGAKIDIIVSGRPTGTMLIYKPEAHPTTVADVTNNTLASKVLDRENLLSANQTATSNGSLTANSGEIVDPDYTSFRIAYDWEGNNVPVQDIAFAVFDGLAKSAQPDGDAPCSYITAVSASSNLVIHIGGGEDPGTTLHVWQVKEAFFLIFFDLCIARKRFEDITFALIWEDKKIAGGFMMKLAPVQGLNNATELTAFE